MKIWIVGKDKDIKVFEDQNEAYAYRGKLSARNGHHKNIPIIGVTWPDDWDDTKPVKDELEKIDA